jgi:hypothetical protein
MDKLSVNWDVLAVLLAVSILHLVFALILYFLARVNSLGSFPINFISDGYLVISFLARTAVLGILILVGLHLGRRVGLGAPLLEAWTKGVSVRERIMSALKISLAGGLGVTAIKYLLDLLVFSPFVPGTLSQWKQVPYGLLLPIPFQQGIGDEIIYRLFWMTVLVWIIWKVQGSGDTMLKDRTYWAGITMAGLISILGVLISGTLIVKLQYAALILTGGIPFGWLYWKKGIESAIVAHFISSVALVLLSLG